MSERPTKRRDLLKYLLGALGGATATLAALQITPTLSRWRTIRFLGRNSVDVDLRKLSVNEILTVTVDFNPVYVLKRSAETVAYLSKSNPDLRDDSSEYSDQPDDAVNSHRSVRPDIFVAYAICTHLGCSPAFSSQNSGNEISKQWSGGYFVCPCHGSVYDAAGRVAKGVPAPSNLKIPDYVFLDEQTVRIFAT